MAIATLPRVRQVPAEDHRVRQLQAENRDLRRRLQRAQELVDEALRALGGAACPGGRSGRPEACRAARRDVQLSGLSRAPLAARARIVNLALVSALANTRTSSEGLEVLVAHAAKLLCRTLDESTERLTVMEINGHMTRIRGEINDARRLAARRHALTTQAFADLVGVELGRPISANLLRRGRPQIPKDWRTRSEHS